MAFFENIPLAPTDPILGITAAFLSDKRPNKINLGVGTYKDANLTPFVLPSVREAERKIVGQDLHKEYLSIEGDSNYLLRIKELVFGNEIERGKIVAVQSVGGTGALRVGSDFLKAHGKKIVYLPDPTWDNHRRVFTHSGFEVRTYPYYSQGGFDFEGMRSAVENIDSGAILLVQGCCHNPTGYDPTKDQWREIIQIVKKRKIITFIDFAYQGFGDGLEEDAWTIREFAKQGVEFLVASSYSKNFGLYAERTGALFLHCLSEKTADKVLSQVKVVIRGIYSNPPCHGARIVAHILGDEKLKGLWHEEVDEMRARILKTRKLLVEAFARSGNKEFSFIEKQKGMFSYTGLSREKVERLTKDYGIYLPLDGRINIAGINHENLETVVSAIVDVL